MGFSWFKDKGDEILNLDYPINENSVVLDIGAHRGKWSLDMSNKHRCCIYAFEPVKKFYQEAVDVLRGHKNVKLFNYGAWVMSTSLHVGVFGVSSSIYLDGKKEVCEFKDIGEILKMCGPVDVMSVNIEGAEYDLLDAMIGRELLFQVRFLNVQFHTNKGINNIYERYESIKNALESTHNLRWRYPFVWESWGPKYSNLF